MAETVTLTIPREALTVVAPPPEFVHQRNVAAVVGLPPAQYLALCRRGAWAVVVEGKLRLARREEVVAYLIDRARMMQRRARLATDGERAAFTDDDMPKGYTRAAPSHRNSLRERRTLLRPGDAAGRKAPAVPVSTPHP